MRNFAVLSVTLTLACCIPKSQVLHLVKPASVIPVVTSRYPAYLEILDEETTLAKRVSVWRADVERHEGVLRKLVRERFDAYKIPLEFKYMYTGLDRTSNIAVLRYFAFHPHPVEIAGWEVFLAYRLSDGRLAKVYVSEVPLE